MGSNKKEYLVENMRKLLFSEKKVMHQIDVTQNIVTARGSKTLLGGWAINELNIKRVRINGSISVQDWVVHFQQLLNPLPP